jgi:serine/threonine protein kinase
MNGTRKSDVSGRARRAGGRARPMVRTVRSTFHRRDPSAAPTGEDSFDQLLRLVARVSEPPPARDDERLPARGSRIGAYRIDRLIACGGMGAVFAATHRNGKQYALKWVLPSIAHEPDVQERFRRELKAGLTIRHANVVRVFGVEDHEGVPFLVMELLRGVSLHARMAKGALALQQALAIFIPVLRGVAAAHAVGVIHRDLKPDNVVLARGAGGLEVPKVLDFGLSKPIGTDPDLATITRRDVVLGTPAFTAPEQLMGEAVDAGADIYSLGIVLYTMLAGRRPFEGTSYSQLLFRIATDRPTPLSELRRDLPRALDAVVARAMARIRGDRFATVAAFAHALVAFQNPVAGAAVARAAG